MSHSVAIIAADVSIRKASEKNIQKYKHNDTLWYNDTLWQKEFKYLHVKAKRGIAYL